MGYDIPNLHIDDESLEGRVVQEIVEREGVTPEEAVRLGLRRAEFKRNPKAIIGLFSAPEDLATFEEAMGHVREMREREIRQMSAPEA